MSEGEGACLGSECVESLLVPLQRLILVVADRQVECRNVVVVVVVVGAVVIDGVIVVAVVVSVLRCRRGTVCAVAFVVAVCAFCCALLRCCWRLRGWTSVEAVHAYAFGCVAHELLASLAADARREQQHESKNNDFDNQLRLRDVSLEARSSTKVRNCFRVRSAAAAQEPTRQS